MRVPSKRVLLIVAVLLLTAPPLLLVLQLLASAAVKLQPCSASSTDRADCHDRQWHLTQPPFAPPPPAHAQSAVSAAVVTTEDAAAAAAAGRAAAQYRVSCSYWVNYRGKQSEPVFSSCVPIADTAEDAQRRRAGRVHSAAVMEANTGDPVRGGGIFFVHHETDAYGGLLDVIHENCRPERVAATAADPDIRRHIRDEFGPSLLQLFLVGPELHAPFLYHVVASGGEDAAAAANASLPSLHPCTYRLRYVVHTSGWYRLHLEWMLTDYHHFMEGQPLWARGLYGQLLDLSAAPQFINATPIALLPPAPAADRQATLSGLRTVGKALMLSLPEAFSRHLRVVGARTELADGYLPPQGVGRWLHRSLFGTAEAPAANDSAVWWPWHSYRHDLSVQHNQTVTDLRPWLFGYADCWFQDIDNYSYVPYLSTVIAQGRLSAAATAEYQTVASQALDYFPSVRPPSAASFNRCFRSLHLTFIGDSHSRCLFNAFVARALNVDNFRAVKDTSNKRVFVPLTDGSRSSDSVSGTAGTGRRLLGFVWGANDSMIDPWHQIQPLATFSSWQCVSKGESLEGETGRHRHLVADACVYQKGWPDGRLPLFHQGIIESDVLLFNFGHWAAANDPEHWPFMKVDHLTLYFDSFFTAWSQANLTAAMHQRQIDRWWAAHPHLQPASALNPFQHRLNASGAALAIPLGSLTLLDLVREKMLWWTSATYSSHFEAHFFSGSDGRTPVRLRLYAEVQKAVVTRWGIRQYSDTRHLMLPFRNCAHIHDFGHALQPIYESQIAAMLDKVGQMRHCTNF